MNRQQRVAHVVALVVIGVCFVGLPAVAQDCPELVGSCCAGPAGVGIGGGRIAVAGHYVYVMDGFYGMSGALHVVDVSNPAAPVEVGFISWTTDGEIKDVAAAGSLAYVLGLDEPNGYPALWIMDFSIPAAPVLVGYFSPLHGWPIQLELSGSYAYVLTSQYFEVIDVSTPEAPELVAEWLCGDPWYNPLAFDVQGGYAYVTVISHDLEPPPWPPWGPYPYLDVYDVGPQSGCWRGEVDDFLPSIDVSSTHLYGVGASSGLHVFDVSEPCAPVEIADSPMPGGWYSGVAVADGYAYVAVPQLYVLDVSDPTNPVLVGTSADNWDVAAVTTDDHYVYATGALEGTGSGVKIFNRCDAVVFHDGFDSGDTSAWSATVP